jgi:hypothetical protein
MLMLRPAIAWQERAAVSGNDARVLELRLIDVPHGPSQRASSPSRPSIAPVVSRRFTHSAKSSRAEAVRRVNRNGQQPGARRLIGPTLVTGVPDPGPHEEAASRDGGFSARLHDARRAYTVRGVPGSDTPYAPGIHLIDPMNQGIGAVVRTIQRAFGIANRHCIDVDVWRHLTPEELSAHYLSPRDVDRVDEKYQCNDPPGLHF